MKKSNSQRELEMKYRRDFNDHDHRAGHYGPNPHIPNDNKSLAVFSELQGGGLTFQVPSSLLDELRTMMEVGGH